MLLEDTRKPTCYYKNWQVKRKSLSFLWVPIQSIHMVNTQLMWLCFSSTSANKWRRNDRILLFCTSDWNHWSGKTINLCSKQEDFLGGSDGKEFACNAGDPGSIPGLGRSPGDGNGNPLQYSFLENSMNRGDWWATVHGVAKSWTHLSDFHICTFPLKAFCKKLMGGM